MRIVALIRRELRLNDNPLFQDADSNEIIPLFVVQDSAAEVANANREHLFFFALAQVRQRISDRGGRLYCVPEVAVEEFLAQARPDLVRLCEDVEPPAREDNARVVRLLDRRRIPHQYLRDHTLAPIPSAPFTTFDRFYKRHFLPSIAAGIPTYPTPRRFTTPKLTVPEITPPQTILPVADWLCSEAQVLGAWEGFVRRRLESYANLQEIPSAEATSRMSPYLRCGMISLGRILRDTRDRSEAFVRNLARHDYFAQLLAHFPQTSERALDAAWWHFPWRHDREAFDRWQAGETGFPLVDAGMRQLAQEGWMDNRMRMVVASFLTRDLLTDWRWGEQYFARQLIDAVPAQNVGNWQWVTGCGGPDSIHYFRVLNPLVQARRFDPNGDYTRRYLPALRAVPANDLIQPDRLHQIVPSYPRPMVDLTQARRTFVEIARGEIRRAKAA